MAERVMKNENLILKKYNILHFLMDLAGHIT